MRSLSKCGQYAVSVVVSAIVTFGVLTVGHCEEPSALRVSERESGNLLGEGWLRAEPESSGVGSVTSISRPFALYGLSVGSDLAATAWAESRGAVEANPIHRNKTARYAISAATVASLTAVDVHLQKKGKKGTARVLRALVVAVRGYAVVHNIRTARRGQ